MGVIPFIVIGAIVIFFIFILVKNIVAPKRSAQLALLYKQNKFGLATKLARQLIQKDPRNPDAHYYLGLCLIAESKPEIALMELKTVNNIGVFEGMVSEVTFRNTIADLFMRFNQFEEAQKEYLLLIQLEPENPQYYFIAGKLFEMRDHADKAVKYYKKTIELDKRHADAYARLGNILFRAKHLPEAKTALEQAVKLQPDNATACFYLGKIYKDNKDFQTALVYFEKAQRDPEHKQKALLERGTCYLNSGDELRAQSELDRAIRQSSSDDSTDTLFARYLLAHIFERQRKFDEAISQWEIINQKKPNFRDVPSKLNEYQDYRSDDRMKDYLTIGDENFVDLCKKIVEKMGSSVQDAKIVDDDVEIIAGEVSNKWRNQKKLPTIFRFLRMTEAIEEAKVRSFYEGLKANQVKRGIIVASSAFSRGSKEFAESRPIDLIDKDRLQKILEEL